IGAPPKAAPKKVTPEELKAAKKVLADALTAKGKKASSLKSVRMEAEGSLTTQGQPLDVTIVRTFKGSDKMRVDLEVDVPKAGLQKISYAIDGKKGWQLTPDGSVDDIPDEDISVLEQQCWHDPEYILTRYKEKGTKIEPESDDKVNGSDC